MNALSHDEAQDLLAAFADGELGPDSRQELEVHLSGCSRCRAALSVQRQLHAKFAREPVPEASSRLVERIRSGLEEPLKARRRAAGRRATLWSGWAVAAALAAILVSGRLPLSPFSRPPMVIEALSNYRAQAARELPAPANRAEQASLPYAREPLTANGARLVSAWKTTLRGEPASVFAYRVGDRVILAYVVSESLFFRQPTMRETVARQGRYVTSDGKESLVAWPLKDSGVLVVGDAPASVLESLRI